MDAEVISELKKFLGRFKETRGAVISLEYIEELEQQVGSIKLSLANNELQISELTAERDSQRRRSEHFQRTAYALETTLQACSQRLNCETGPAVVLELDKLKSRCERAEALSTPATPDTEAT